MSYRTGFPDGGQQQFEKRADGKIYRVERNEGARFPDPPTAAEVAKHDAERATKRADIAARTTIDAATITPGFYWAWCATGKPEFVEVEAETDSFWRPGKQVGRIGCEDTQGLAEFLAGVTHMRRVKTPRRPA